jgi:hypothetical protein
MEVVNFIFLYLEKARNYVGAVSTSQVLYFYFKKLSIYGPVVLTT